MANRRFTDNPAASTLDGTEIFPLTQGGVDKKATTTQVRAGLLPLAGGTTTGPVTIGASQELLIAPRGATNYPGQIRFQTTTFSNEVQSITQGGAGLTSYTLTFSGQTTVAIAQAATAATVQTALTALSTIGAGNVSVTGANGGPYTVTFVGALANTDVPQMTATPTGGTGTVTIATVTSGALPSAPSWFFAVGNAFTQDYDHVFHHTFNMRWDDFGNTWVREFDGSHAIRFGFESSFRDYAADPLAIKGSFEWNLDIFPTLAGAVGTPVRPWFFVYDMDIGKASLAMGDIVDRSRNVFQMFGSLSEVSSVALKDGGGIGYFQLSRDTPGAGTSVVSMYTTNGRLDINAGNNEEVRIGNPSGTGGSTWLQSTVEARSDINVLGKIKWNSAGNIQTTVGAAGGASALPAAPSKYLKVLDNAGSVFVIPAYAAS